MSQFKDALTDILRKETGAQEIRLEIPPDPSLGDFAFPCFSVSKRLGKSPVDIANQLAPILGKQDFVERVEVKGPYLNIFVKKALLAHRAINQTLDGKNQFPRLKQTVLVESPGPNTNKPLHLGHLRNMALGIAISSILKKYGFKVINVDII